MKMQMKLIAAFAIAAMMLFSFAFIVNDADQTDAGPLLGSPENDESLDDEVNIYITGDVSQDITVNDGVTAEVYGDVIINGATITFKDGSILYVNMIEDVSATGSGTLVMEAGSSVYFEGLPSSSVIPVTEDVTIELDGSVVYDIEMSIDTSTFKADVTATLSVPQSTSITVNGVQFSFTGDFTAALGAVIEFSGNIIDVFMGGSFADLGIKANGNFLMSVPTIDMKYGNEVLGTITSGLSGCSFSLDTPIYNNTDKANFTMAGTSVLYAVVENVDVVYNLYVDLTAVISGITPDVSISDLSSLDNLDVDLTFDIDASTTVDSTTETYTIDGLTAKNTMSLKNSVLQYVDSIELDGLEIATEEFGMTVSGISISDTMTIDMSTLHNPFSFAKIEDMISFFMNYETDIDTWEEFIEELIPDDFLESEDYLTIREMIDSFLAGDSLDEVLAIADLGDVDVLALAESYGVDLSEIDMDLFGAYMRDADIDLDTISEIDTTFMIPYVLAAMNYDWSDFMGDAGYCTFTYKGTFDIGQIEVTTEEMMATYDGFKMEADSSTDTFTMESGKMKFAVNKEDLMMFLFLPSEKLTVKEDVLTFETKGDVSCGYAAGDDSSYMLIEDLEYVIKITVNDSLLAYSATTDIGNIEINMNGYDLEIDGVSTKDLFSIDMTTANNPFTAERFMEIIEFVTSYESDADSWDDIFGDLIPEDCQLFEQLLAVAMQYVDVEAIAPLTDMIREIDAIDAEDMDVSFNIDIDFDALIPYVDGLMHYDWYGLVDEISFPTVTIKETIDVGSVYVTGPGMDFAYDGYSVEIDAVKETMKIVSLDCEFTLSNDNMLISAELPSFNLKLEDGTYNLLLVGDLEIECYSENVNFEVEMDTITFNADFTIDEGVMDVRYRLLVGEFSVLSDSVYVEMYDLEFEYTGELDLSDLDFDDIMAVIEDIMEHPPSSILEVIMNINDYIPADIVFSGDMSLYLDEARVITSSMDFYAEDLAVEVGYMGDTTDADYDFDLYVKADSLVENGLGSTMLLSDFEFLAFTAEGVITFECYGDTTTILYNSGEAVRFTTLEDFVYKGTFQNMSVNYTQASGHKSVTSYGITFDYGYVEDLSLFSDSHYDRIDVSGFYIGDYDFNVRALSSIDGYIENVESSLFEMTFEKIDITFTTVDGYKARLTGTSNGTTSDLKLSADGPFIMDDIFATYFIFGSILYSTDNTLEIDGGIVLVNQYDVYSDWTIKGPLYLLDGYSMVEVNDNLILQVEFVGASFGLDKSTGDMYIDFVPGYTVDKSSCVGFTLDGNKIILDPSIIQTGFGTISIQAEPVAVTYTLDGVSYNAHYMDYIEKSVGSSVLWVADSNGKTYGWVDDGVWMFSYDTIQSLELKTVTGSKVKNIDYEDVNRVDDSFYFDIPEDFEKASFQTPSGVIVTMDPDDGYYEGTAKASIIPVEETSGSLTFDITANGPITVKIPVENEDCVLYHMVNGNKVRMNATLVKNMDETYLEAKLFSYSLYVVEFEPEKTNSNSDLYNAFLIIIIVAIAIAGVAHIEHNRKH